MILINLLPHREERRKRRRAAFFAGLALAALVGVGVIALWYGVLQQMISNQQGRNSFLQAEIGKLEAQIKNIATLRAEIEALRARQAAVENLQLDRNVPVHILNELVRQTPEGIYLTSVRQDGQVLSVSGISQSNERMSEFLRNTGSSSWLTKPELVEIKLAAAPGGRPRQPGQPSLFDFSMRIGVKRQQDQAAAVAGAASAASAPAATVARQPS